MLEQFKKDVYEANMELQRKNLIIFTWGNVSGRYDENMIVIKPSGIPYEELKPSDMVLVELNNTVKEGQLKPSSDTPTHIELYKAFPELKGVCHTHSVYATAFAQAGLAIKPFGTTHADYFYGDIPCTRKLTKEETENEYEKNTGRVIIETFKDKNVIELPGVLVQQHGVFSWGKSPMAATHSAIVMEEIAKMNYLTLTLNQKENILPQYTLDKHYLRKHGKNAYYGQK